MRFQSRVKGESNYQQVRHTAKVCYSQAKEAIIGHRGQPHLVEHNHVCDVAGQSKDTDRNCDTECVEAYCV